MNKIEQRIYDSVFNETGKRVGVDGVRRIIAALDIIILPADETPQEGDTVELTLEDRNGIHIEPIRIKSIFWEENITYGKLISSKIIKRGSSLVMEDV